ncbi:MAG: hypothetical protein QG657_2071, partial [Acidobacteriota bacterium]|nr:hypothetical protein [Acidobacteriota bacterium]
MKKIISLYFVIVFLTFSIFLVSKEPQRIPVTSAKIKIDGVLDEKAWEQALVMELKYEVQPGENIVPPVRTEVLFLYSKTHFYVGFRAYDPDPSRIRSVFRERDQIGGDDWVSISLDTFNDQRHSYGFYCNPFGIQLDEISTPEGSGESWDAIWDSAGKLTKEGYLVEIAIPFSSLRFQRKSGDQVWGIDAIRSYPRNVRHLISIFPWDRSNNCYMCQAEKVVGFAGASPGKNIELDPTVMGILTQRRENGTEGDFHTTTDKIEPGLTARWGITPSLTLSAAINPDFSNVEADVTQLDINRRFAIYYPEKRPFFLEGGSIFNTLLSPVYTRSLADPDWGIKVTGKEGANAIGFFSVRDHMANFLFPGSQGSHSDSLEMGVVGSVLRYRRDIGKSSTLGCLVTDREGKGYFNRLAGLDGDLKVTPKDRIRFQFLGSQTQYPESVAEDNQQPQNSFWGSALDLYYIHDTRTFDWFIDYTDISANFRADLGFMPQAGFRKLYFGATHTWNRRGDHWFNILTIGPSYQVEKDHDNNPLYHGLTFDMTYRGPVQSTFNLTGNFGKRTYVGLEFDENYVSFNGSIVPSRVINFFVYGLIGDGIDFDNMQPGDQVQLEGFVDYKLGRHLQFRLDHKFEHFNVKGGRLYTANASFFL